VSRFRFFWERVGTIIVEGKVVGAMGASGNSPQEDEDIALAGAVLTPAAIQEEGKWKIRGPAWFPEYDLRARTAGGGVQTIQPRTGDASQTTANQSAAAPARITWIGLFGALFGLVVIRDIVRLIAPDPSTLVVAVREAMILASAAGLLLVVRRLEGLPFTSIGLGTSRWWKSVLWGLLTSILCGGVAVALAKATGYGQGPASAAFDRLPSWLISVIVFRAGIVEELFYRGYAIERMQALGMRRSFAAVVSWVVFSLGHYAGGPANILIALVLGGILTAFYLWRRDLVANILAHTLVDFVANVLPRLIPS